MSDESQSDSIATEAAGSAEVSEQKDTVSYESHAKLLKQLKAQKAQMDDVSSLREELNSMKAEKEAHTEAAMQKKGDYQAIIESRDAKIKELMESSAAAQAERDHASKTLNDSYKLNAFMNRLPGKLASNDYLSFVDLDSIGMADGRVDSESVELAVAGFVERHSRLIEPVSMAKLPAGDTKTPSASAPLEGKAAIKDALLDALS